MYIVRPVVLCLLGLFQTAYVCAQDVDRQEMIHEMRVDIVYLASDYLEGRAVGTQGEIRAAEYIAWRMAELGLKPVDADGSYYQHFSVNATNPHDLSFDDSRDSSVHGRNVVGFIDHGAAATVVIGAHYDHLGYGDTFMGSLHPGEPAIHNGADDNASGVAALLQLAEICTDKYTNNNYLFIAFSGEERGLWGSNYYVKNPLLPLDKMNYMLNMDMVGRLKEEKKLSVNAVATAPQWMPALESIDVGGIEIVTTESGVGASDHTSFYFEQVPALHFFTGQHHDYHKPSDDVETINFEGLADVVLFIEQLIKELEDDGKLAFQETKVDQPAARDFKVTLGVMPDYLYTDGGMRIDGVRPDRPAANGGLEKGDIVVKMGEHEIGDMYAYMEALSKFKPGQVVPVEVIREEELLRFEITFD